MVSVQALVESYLIKQGHHHTHRVWTLCNAKFKVKYSTTTTTTTTTTSTFAVLTVEFWIKQVALFVGVSPIDVIKVGLGTCYPEIYRAGQRPQSVWLLNGFSVITAFNNQRNQNICERTEALRRLKNGAHRFKTCDEQSAGFNERQPNHTSFSHIETLCFNNCIEP